MKNKHMLVVVLLVCLSVSAVAGTIFVEKDGSGDFVSIQTAVEAAASGDTIRIGPGRWAQKFEYSVPGGESWTDSVIVAVDYKDMTLIGSGQGVTFIGPEDAMPYGYPGPMGVLSLTDNYLSVQDITIEHMRSGVYYFGVDLSVKRVEFRDSYIGSVFGADNRVEFRECQFINCTSDGIIGTHRNTTVYIDGCVFENDPLNGGISIVLQNIEDILITECEFSGAGAAIQFDGPTCSGIVRDCVVFSGIGPHFTSISGANMDLQGNELWGGGRQLGARGTGRVTGSNNIFHGPDWDVANHWTISLGRGFLDLHNNHILKGKGSLTVYTYNYNIYDDVVHDLTNNWWGTTDTDSIEAWILDIHDNPDEHVEILYDPILESPVPSEKKSMSDLKSLFR